MRKFLQFLGVVLLFQGVSGAIDHVAVQPFFGPFLNFFNRVVLPRVGVLAGYELLANLALAAIGFLVVVAAERNQPS